MDNITDNLNIEHNENIKADSFVFYRSFYEALKDFEDEDFKDVVCAICNYALNGIEKTFNSPIRQSLFTLIKPQIDANLKRRAIGRENGKKGGRPKKQETQNAPAPAPAQNENVFNIPTLEEVRDFATSHNYININVEKFYNYYSGLNWKTSNGKSFDWKLKLFDWNKSERTPVPAENESHIVAPMQYDLTKIIAN